MLLYLPLFPMYRNLFLLFNCVCTFFLCLSHSAIIPWRRQPPSWELVQRTCTSSKQMKGKKVKAMTLICQPFKNAVVLYITNLFECNWKSFKSVSLRGKMIPEELEKQVQRARKEVRGGERAWRREECMQTVCLCLSERRKTKSD